MKLYSAASRHAALSCLHFDTHTLIGTLNRLIQPHTDVVQDIVDAGRTTTPQSMKSWDAQEIYLTALDHMIARDNDRGVPNMAVLAAFDQAVKSVEGG